MSASNRILIHFAENEIAPKGGPAGYLCNLKQGLQNNVINNIEFLPNVGVSYEQNSTLKKIIPSRIKDFRRLRNMLSLPDKTALPVVDYSNYDAIHFHSTEELYLYRRALDSYEGKVVLTSHSPCVYHKELIDRLNPIDSKRHSKALERLEIIDEYAFKRADYVIFPCEEAEEPYFHTWKQYQDVRDRGKLRYVPTGIAPAYALNSRRAIREQYGIPENAFVVCYAGRHNHIKGYDILESVADTLLNDENIWFLVAGREGPLYGLNHKRWIEAGWTDDPHSLIAASDAFILPNRETYFDLVMLEVLSLGKIVIASNTGGNSYFKQFNSPGILLYDDFAAIAEIVNQLIGMTHEERDSLGAMNQDIYRKEFTVDTFALRYQNVMKEICGVK